MSDVANDAVAMLFNPMAPEFRTDPYPFYAQMREAAAAVRTPFGSTMVTRYEDVDRVLKSSQFRTLRGYRDPDDPAGPARFDASGALSRHRRLWLLFQTGEPHARVRRLITKVFTPRAVSRLAPRIESFRTRCDHRAGDGSPRMADVARAARPRRASNRRPRLGVMGRPR